MIVDVWVSDEPKIGDEIKYITTIDGKGNVEEEAYVIIDVYERIGRAGRYQVWRVEVEKMDGSLRQI